MERALGEQTVECRLLGALLALDLMSRMLTAGIWVLEANTMMSRIAGLSSFPQAMAYLWMALAVGVLPYFCMQAFGLGLKWRRKITRLACRTILFSGVLWAFLAYLSKNIDSTHIKGIFLLHSFIAVAMSAILASSINTAQGHEASRALSPESQE